MTVHPFLIALFPLLSLYVHNQHQLSLRELPQPVLVVLIFTALLWGLFGLVLSDRNKSAFITSVFLILFFSFGHVVNDARFVFLALGGSREASGLLESIPALFAWLSLGAFLFAIVFVLTTRAALDLSHISRFLDIFSLALLLIVVANGVSSRVHDATIYSFPDKWEKELRTMGMSDRARPLPEHRPDIYYIILDGYARSDVLRELYGQDNTAFTTYLMQKGFYVASQSHANYSQTALSLASSLNSLYLDELVSEIATQSVDRLPLATMIGNNGTFQFLRERGYRIIAFSSGYTFTEIDRADRYFAPAFYLTDYANGVVNTTPLPLILRLPFLRTQYDLHREHLLYTLDHLPDAALEDGPVFVFAHIIAPHPPFVFGANGEPLRPDRFFHLGDGTDLTTSMSREEYIKEYKNQITFVTSKITTAVDKILARSPDAPVIILQADHGPGAMLDWFSAENSNLSERMSILNAYYFPDQDYSLLYSSITPVNTFHTVFNHLWGSSAPLLPDKSYFSGFYRPYDFVDVTSYLSDNSVH
jgi:hypothetical protein